MKSGYRGRVSGFGKTVSNFTNNFVVQIVRVKPLVNPFIANHTVGAHSYAPLRKIENPFIANFAVGARAPTHSQRIRSNSVHKLRTSPLHTIEPPSIVGAIIF
jgi:hypothetical protein